MLEVGEKQVDKRQSGFDVFPRHVQAGFDRGVDPRVVAGLKELSGQFGIHKRLAAGKRDAAAAAVVKRFVAQHRSHNLFDAFLFAAHG